MDEVDVLDVFFVHFFLDGHTLITGKMRTTRPLHLSLGCEESPSFSLPTNHTPFLPQWTPPKTSYPPKNSLQKIPQEIPVSILRIHI